MADFGYGFWDSEQGPPEDEVFLTYQLQRLVKVKVVIRIMYWCK
jgi:hypothetical protein